MKSLKRTSRRRLKKELVSLFKKVDGMLASYDITNGRFEEVFNELDRRGVPITVEYGKWIWADLRRHNKRKIK